MDFKTLVQKEIESAKNNMQVASYPAIDALKERPTFKSKFLNTISRFKKNISPSEEIIEKMNSLSQVYNTLNDNYSKEILVKVITYRLLGPKKYKLPLYSNKLNELLLNSKKWYDKNKNITLNRRKDFVLYLFNLKPIGIDIKLYSTPMSVIAEHIFKQYEYNHSNTIIQANKGDYVLDVGGFNGDTALYFSYAVGNTGRIFSWEFIPSNLNIFKQNLNWNKKLSSNIEIIKYPAYLKSNMEFYFTDRGPSSRIKFHKPIHYDGKVKTLSIDDYVINNEIEKIDFIKMDIEAAELDALRGAKKTILKFKPKLAISIYHQLIDFIDIPHFIMSLDLNYKIYIDHFTAGEYETILFAEID